MMENMFGLTGVSTDVEKAVLRGIIFRGLKQGLMVGFPAIMLDREIKFNFNFKLLCMDKMYMWRH